VTSAESVQVRPKVLIDGYFFEKPFGFGRYISELVDALARARQDLSVTVAVPGPVRPGLVEQFAHGAVDLTFLPHALLPLWEQWTVPRFARAGNYDVIHSPYNTRAVWTRGVPCVTTVHDLVFLERKVRRQQGFKDRVHRRYTSTLFGLTTTRSAVVTTVSGATSRALAERGVTATVVYNTADRLLRSAPEGAPNGARYFMHRGGAAPHRNTERVIRAFEMVRRTNTDLQLRIVGMPSGDRHFDKVERDGVTFLTWQTDAQIAGLYASAAGVIAPSLEEGFGLPIIEGFGSATPVITSDIDPMREVAGGAALLVNPFSVREIADAIASVASDLELERSLAQAGARRYAAFSGDAVAASMLAVYKRAAALKACG